MQSVCLYQIMYMRRGKENSVPSKLKNGQAAGSSAPTRLRVQRSCTLGLELNVKRNSSFDNPYLTNINPVP